MRKSLLFLSITIAAIVFFGWPKATGAEAICSPTPPNGMPRLNIWPIQTDGADCTDYPLLAVKNQAGGDYVSGGTISANPDDTLKVRLYVHNGVLDYPENKAFNVMVAASIPNGNGNQTITADAWADNADGINSGSKGGNVAINLGSTDHLEFVPGSGQVYGRGPVLLGSFPDSVVTGGASLGDMPGCFPYLRFVTFLVRVVHENPPVGTINVASNVPTSWVITGPDNFSGSGNSASYTATPSTSDYFISAPNLSGYKPPVISPSINQTLAPDGSIDFNIFYDIIIPPQNKGTIVVNSNIPTSWVISGPANYSGSGTSSVYTDVPTSPPDYRISAPTIAGYNGPVISPSATQSLSNQGTITFSLNYSPVVAGCTDGATVTPVTPLPSAALNPGQSYQFTIKVRNSGDTWWYDGSYYRLLQTESLSLTPTYGHISPDMAPGDEQDKTFSLTAPSVQGNYSMRFVMVHRAGAAYMRPGGITCGGSPGSDIYFGNALTMPFTVGTGGGPTLTAPILNQADNSSCGSIALNWTDRSNNEDGFKVLRSASATSGFALIGTLPANTTSFTDTPPSNTGYHYRVDAYINSPALTSPSNVIGPVMSTVCSADLSQSKKKLASVTELISGRTSAYSNTSIIKNGDTLTYEILLRNQGNVQASIFRVVDHLEGNLINPRNARLSRPDGSGPISISRNGDDIIFGASGSLPANTNWVVSFDVTFVTSSSRNAELIKNCATIYYRDTADRDLTVCHGPVLVNRVGGGAPKYREVVP